MQRSGRWPGPRLRRLLARTRQLVHQVTTNPTMMRPGSRPHHQFQAADQGCRRAIVSWCVCWVPPRSISATGVPALPWVTSCSRMVARERAPYRRPAFAVFVAAAEVGSGAPQRVGGDETHALGVIAVGQRNAGVGRAAAWLR